VKRPRRATALLALAAALLTGCSGRTPPTVSVTGATLRDRSPEAAVVEFVIEARNPNDIELPMRQVVYTLSVDGRRVFEATRDAQATMPRNGVQTITIPAVVPLRGERAVEPGLLPYRLSGRIYYSLPSQLADVLFDAKLSRPNVGISDRGEIDLR
jgi:hypothetical protein